MIEVRNLTKQYGSVTAVDDISFTVHPGLVTGFLGPNGAGKSTTMRMILGLDRPTGGSVLVNGSRYRKSPAPVHEIAEVARQKAGGFSLGMGQRLGIAVALLGDPGIVMLDEPVNGLDPDGVLWIRTLLRALADEGRTVFLSSHLMTEMELIADQLIIIGRGKILADTSMKQFIDSWSSNRVRVIASDISALQGVLAASAQSFEIDTHGALIVTGLSAADIGKAAFASSIALMELTPLNVSLEEAFMDLTRASVQFHTGEVAA